MTTLNVLHRTWDSFIQGICAKKKLVKFNRLWEECWQEEAWIAALEENMGSEDQTFIVQSRKNIRDYHHHSKGKRPSSRKTQLWCYTCDEIGNCARDYPRNKRNSHKKKKNKRSHHSHAAEDYEPSKKRIKKESDEEYVLISALTGNITHGSNDWLIDSGASKHMTGFKESFLNYQNMNHLTRWS